MAMTPGDESTVSLRCWEPFTQSQGHILEDMNPQLSVFVGCMYVAILP